MEQVRLAATVMNIHVDSLQQGPCWGLCVGWGLMCGVGVRESVGEWKVCIGGVGEVDGNNYVHTQIPYLLH